MSESAKKIQQRINKKTKEYIKKIKKPIERMDFLIFIAWIILQAGFFLTSFIVDFEAPLWSWYIPTIIYLPFLLFTTLINIYVDKILEIFKDEDLKDDQT